MKSRISFVTGVIRYIALRNIEVLKKDYVVSARRLLDLDEPIENVELDAKTLFLLRASKNKSWPQRIYEMIPHILVKEFNNGDIAIGAVNARCAEKLADSLSISSFDLDPSLVYENLNYRREARFELDHADYFLHQQFLLDCAHQFSHELSSIPDGKGSFSEYETIVKKILDLFFDDLGIIGEQQKEIANRHSRLDICYYMQPRGCIFYNKLFKDTNSSHLIIECKNSKNSKELGKAISQVQKYFTMTNVCNAGIITIRDKSKLYKMKHYSKMIQNDQLFLIVLDDSDLIELITRKQDYTLFESSSGDCEVYESSPLSELYKLKCENIITYS